MTSEAFSDAPGGKTQGEACWRTALPSASSFITSVLPPLWLLFPLGEMPMYKGFQPFWIGDWLEKNGEGWERRVKDWLYPYPQCSCVCDKNRRGDCWMTAVSDLPGWRFWGYPNTALVLCSALWNVYSAMRNVYSPLRNVHSALRNINRMPVLAKLEQDEWILLNSYAACICIPVGVGRGPVVNSYITCICYFPFCSGKGSCALPKSESEVLKSNIYW